MAALALLFWWLRPETLDESYFPIAVGDKWVYQSKSADMTEDIVFEVTGKQQMGIAECFVVQRSIGDHQSTFYVEVKHRGVWIHQIGKDRYAPPFRQFAFGTRGGATWEYKGKLGGQPAEYTSKNEGLFDIEAPAGKFRVFQVNQFSQGYAHFWLAKGVGVVKLSGKTWDEHDPDSAADSPLYFDWELKSFSRK